MLGNLYLFSMNGVLCTLHLCWSISICNAIGNTMHFTQTILRWRPLQIIWIHYGFAISRPWSVIEIVWSKGTNYCTKAYLLKCIVFLLNVLLVLFVSLQSCSLPWLWAHITLGPFCPQDIFRLLKSTFYLSYAKI